MNLLLEAYYEPRFSDKSHGFRPIRGCHTALMQIGQSHRDVSWFIEGDIKGFFDNIDHERLVGIVKQDIQDGRFLNLLRLLKIIKYPRKVPGTCHASDPVLHNHAVVVREVPGTFGYLFS